MYRLIPVTEEERVARDILLDEHPAAIIHVTDAKNLERMLPMTLQLIEAGLPVILVANLMDEAERLKVQINLTDLEQTLGIPVVGTALALGRGTSQLKGILASILLHGSKRTLSLECESRLVTYHSGIEEALKQIEALLLGTTRSQNAPLACCCCRTMQVWQRWLPPRKAPGPRISNPSLNPLRSDSTNRSIILSSSSSARSPGISCSLLSRNRRCTKMALQSS